MTLEEALAKAGYKPFRPLYDYIQNWHRRARFRPLCLCNGCNFFYVYLSSYGPATIELRQQCPDGTWLKVAFYADPSDLADYLRSYEHRLVAAWKAANRTVKRNKPC